MKTKQWMMEPEHKTAFLRVKRALTLPVILATVAFLMPFGDSRAVPAQQPAPAMAGAAYKVIDISQIPVGNGMAAAQTLEALLNELASKGWRVVAISGNLIVLTSG